MKIDPDSDRFHVLMVRCLLLCSIVGTVVAMQHRMWIIGGAMVVLCLPAVVLIAWEVHYTVVNQLYWRERQRRLRELGERNRRNRTP